MRNLLLLTFVHSFILCLRQQKYEERLFQEPFNACNLNRTMFVVDAQPNAKYAKLYTWGGQPVRDQELHFYCVTTKSHIMHVGTHEHHPISSSLTHIPLLS